MHMYMCSVGKMRSWIEDIRSMFDGLTSLNQKVLKHFLGLASYYCRFVQRFAQEAAPLIALIDKGKDWLWTAVYTSTSHHNHSSVGKNF